MRNAPTDPQLYAIYSVQKTGSMFLHRLSKEIASELRIERISCNDEVGHARLDKSSRQGLMCSKPSATGLIVGPW